MKNPCWLALLRNVKFENFLLYVCWKIDSCNIHTLNFILCPYEQHQFCLCIREAMNHWLWWLKNNTNWYFSIIFFFWWLHELLNYWKHTPRVPFFIYPFDVLISLDDFRIENKARTIERIVTVLHHRYDEYKKLFPRQWKQNKTKMEWNETDHNSIEKVVLSIVLVTW